jgi:hypothetical protein
MVCPPSPTCVIIHQLDSSGGIVHADRRIKKFSIQKKVNFAIGPATIVAFVPNRETYTDNDRMLQFYLPSEYSSIRLAAKLDTRNIREKFLSIVHDVEKAHWLLLQGQSVEPQMLYNWNTKGCGRGLERYVSSSHRKARYEIMNRAKMVVMNKALDDEERAWIYQHTTEMAAQHARLFGMADALAVQEHDEVSTRRLSRVLQKGRRMLFRQSSLYIDEEDEGFRQLQQSTLVTV